MTPYFKLLNPSKQSKNLDLASYENHKNFRQKSCNPLHNVEPTTTMKRKEKATSIESTHARRSLSSIFLERIAISFCNTYRQRRVVF